MILTSGWNFEVAVRTLWMEAGGEPLRGQQAVAHALINRLKSGRWGHSLAEVCLAPLQFSSWNTKDGNRRRMARLSDDDPLLEPLRHVLAEAENDVVDFTAGAMWYYSPRAMVPTGAVPPWVTHATFCGEFGQQLFYKGL